MNRIFKLFILMIVILLSPGMRPAFGQAEVKQKPPAKEAKGYLAALHNNRTAKGCYPAEVIGVMQSDAPPEGLEVVIKNFSWKIIHAVKVSWYIVEDEEKTLGQRLLKQSCDAPSLPDEILLSGETGLIETGPLHPQQTAAMGKKPLRFIYDRQDRVLALDFDFITTDEVKDLMAEGTPKTFKKIYAVVFGVSEVQFADGTAWRAEGAPEATPPEPN